MNKRFIIANWKSNKTSKEILVFLDTFEKSTSNDTSKEIVICPSVIHIQLLKDEVDRRRLPIKIGAQDISATGSGAHTGEVNGQQLKELVSYVIIGHSERRKGGEGPNTIHQKIEQALQNSIIPILCVSEIHQIDEYLLEGSQIIIAYEPLFAIGSGKADTPENANSIAQKIREKINSNVLYGGSVTSKNVSEFTSQEEISGVLVGGASLDANEFSLLIQHA